MKWPFGKRPIPYLAVVEYWVYIPGEKIPPQDLLTGRMLRSTPFKVDGQAACGPGEGLLFSDIRLHMGLVLKTKNPHLFRPDLFERHVEPTAQVLEALSEAQSLVKMRYLSPEILKDDRYLRFMPHLAESCAYFGKSKVIFDCVSERLVHLDDWRAEMTQQPDTANPDFHLRTVWVEEEEGGHATTRGLMKVGLPELKTHLAPSDHRVVIHDVLEQAAQQLWQTQKIPERLEVHAYDDDFEVVFEPQKKGPVMVRLMRRRTL